MTYNEIQNNVFNLVMNDDSSLADHLATNRELSQWSGEWPEYFRSSRVAFLSNFTLQGLPEVFKVRAIFNHLNIHTYLASYNQYAQEILNNHSNLYRYNPSLVFLLVDLSDIDRTIIASLVRKLLLDTPAHVVIFNKELASEFAGEKRVFVFDWEKFLSKIGQDKYWYTKFKELGDFRLSPEAFPLLADALMGYAVSCSGATKKCLVTDLDNTLWAGVVGEDGWEKVAPDKELQSHIIQLHKEGIILAINSKNNEADALEVLDKHPEIILRQDHFAAWQINWKDKAVNMVELARALNLGLDSFVFMDDDPFQRESVRRVWPMVTVIPPNFLESYAGFCNFNITPEDAKRGQMYVEEKQRRETQVSLNSVEDFLRELNMEVMIKPADDSSISRVAQLTQKTNQFNLTTQRYSEQDIKCFIQLGWRVWSVSAKDKFGDYGIIGVGIVEPKGLVWRIDTLLFSCRILGREVEKAFLTHIVNQARAYDVQAVEGDFIPTAKNEPCKSFYDANGFDVVGDSDGRKFYCYHLTNGPALDYPGFLKVVSV